MSANRRLFEMMYRKEVARNCYYDHESHSSSNSVPGFFSDEAADTVFFVGAITVDAAGLSDSTVSVDWISGSVLTAGRGTALVSSSSASQLSPEAEQKTSLELMLFDPLLRTCITFFSRNNRRLQFYGFLGFARWFSCLRLLLDSR